MSYVDLLIVYLACGSPFAVYEATTRAIGTRFTRAGRAIFALVFWPWLAFTLVKGRTARVLSGRRGIKELEDTRITIESGLFPDRSSTGIFEFRDSFYRFVGLDEASMENQSTNTFEIFNVVNHPNGALASRILGRTNLRKINAHKLRAREEFVNVLARNTQSNGNIELRDAVTRLSPTLRLPEPLEVSLTLDPGSPEKNRAHV